MHLVVWCGVRGPRCVLSAVVSRVGSRVSDSLSGGRLRCMGEGEGEGEGAGDAEADVSRYSVESTALPL